MYQISQNGHFRRIVVRMDLFVELFLDNFQVFFTATKVIALLVITVIGIYQVSNGKVENFKNSFEGTNTGILPIAKAIMVSSKPILTISSTL